MEALQELFDFFTRANVVAKDISEIVLAVEKGCLETGQIGILGDKNMILETERLYLREMNQCDFKSLCKILQDEETMAAYEGAFSDSEAQEWLDRQILKAKMGLWLMGGHPKTNE